MANAGRLFGKLGDPLFEKFGRPLAADLRRAKMAVIEDGTGAGKKQAGDFSKRSHSHEAEARGVFDFKKTEQSRDVGGLAGGGCDFYDIAVSEMGALDEFAESRDGGGFVEIVRGENDAFSHGAGF